MAGHTTKAGYGWSHQKKRARWAPIVAQGRAICWRCRKIIQPGEPWDLGHHDLDRSRYMGPEHSACNRGAGPIWARRRRQAQRAPALALFD